MAAAMVGAGFKPAHTYEMHHTHRNPRWRPQTESRAGIDRHETSLSALHLLSLPIPPNAPDYHVSCNLGPDSCGGNCQTMHSREMRGSVIVSIGSDDDNAPVSPCRMSQFFDRNRAQNRRFRDGTAGFCYNGANCETTHIGELGEFCGAAVVWAGLKPDPTVPSTRFSWATMLHHMVSQLVQLTLGIERILLIRTVGCCTRGNPNRAVPLLAKLASPWGDVRWHVLRSVSQAPPGEIVCGR